MKNRTICLFLAGMLFSLESAMGYKAGNVEISLKGSVRQAYDDNVTYASDNARKDMHSDTAVGISTAYEGKSCALSAACSLVRQFFYSNRRFDNFQEFADIKSGIDISPLERLVIQDKFSHTDSPRSFEDDFGGSAVRFSQYRNTLNGTYFRDITRQLGLAVSYANDYFRNTRDDLPGLSLNRFTAEADYSLSSKTRVITAIDYFLRIYESVGNMHTVRFSGGLRRYFTAQLYLDLRAGIDRTRTLDKDNRTSGFHAVSLIDDVNETTQLNLTYTSEEAPTSWSSELFKQERVSLSARKVFLNRLYASFSGFAGKGSYKVSEVKDNLRGLSFGLSYDLTANLMLGLDLTHTNVKSNFASRGYDKNTVSLGLTYSF